MSIFDTIHSTIDLADYAGKCGVNLQKRGQYWKGLCPFHAEKTASFTIKAGERKFTCYGCGVHGDVIDFAMAIHNLDTAGAIDKLCDTYNIQRQKKNPDKHIQRWYKLLEEVARLYQKSLLNSEKAAHARKHLHERGISDEDIQHWELGYAPPGNMLCKHLMELGYNDVELKLIGIMSEKGKDYFYNRIMFPIHDRKGRIVGFGARQLNNSGPKYINSPESPMFKKSQLLYGHHHASISETAIVVEGYTDVISAHRAGHRNVVAQMGSALSDRQLDMLKKSKKLYLAFDGDTAGRKAIERVLDNLTIEHDIHLIFLENNQDVDDAIRCGNFSTAIANALSALDYVVQKTIDAIPENASTIERTRIAKQALPLIMRLESDIARATSVQTLAHGLNLNVASLLNSAYQQIPRSKTEPIIKTSSPTIEASLVGAMLHDRGVFHAIETCLTELDEPELSPDDFIEYHHLIKIYLDGIKEMIHEIDEYVRDILGDDTLPELIAIPQEMVVRYFCRMRTERLLLLTQNAIDKGDFQMVNSLNIRKRKLLRMFKTGISQH